MRQTQRAAIQRLASDLQKANSVDADRIKELAGLLFDDARHKLVDAMGEDLLKMQGEAKAWQKLVGMLTRAPITTQEH